LVLLIANCSRGAQRTALTLDEAVLELNRYRRAFLKQVQRQVKELIAKKSKRECTAIVATDSSGRRTTWTACERGWRRRAWYMIRKGDGGDPEKPSLPLYEGEHLDSSLSAPIVEKVNEIHAQFLAQHGDVIVKHMMERIRYNPQLQRVIAIHTVSTLRDAARPLTDEMKNIVFNLVLLELSGQVTDEVSSQMGDIMLQVVGGATLSAFNSALLHAFHGALGKVVHSLLLTSAFHSGYTSAGLVIAKAVILGSVASGGTALAAHSTGAVCTVSLASFCCPLWSASSSGSSSASPKRWAAGWRSRSRRC
jgi:hypothetical protein